MKFPRIWTLFCLILCFGILFSACGEKREENASSQEESSAPSSSATVGQVAAVEESAITLQLGTLSGQEFVAGEETIAFLLSEETVIERRDSSGQATQGGVEDVAVGAILSVEMSKDGYAQKIAVYMGAVFKE